MSGKRAKPSRWRFLRVAPLAVVAAVVWVMIAFFLLSPDSGDDQAHNWGIGPAPSGGDGESTAGPKPEPADPATTEAPRTPSSESASPVADSPSSRTPAPAAPAGSSPTQRDALAPGPAPAPTDDAPTQPTTSQPPTPDPSQPTAEAVRDNPGKKKGHRDGHGPNDDRP